MRKRIYLSICVVSSFAVLLTGIFVTCAVSANYYNDLKTSVKLEASYAASANRIDLEYFNTVKWISESRITLISPDGTVIFDSDTNPASMDNHADRVEVISAIANGEGEDTRLSQTLDKKTYYFAKLLSNGNILRSSRSTTSLYQNIFMTLPYIICIIITVILLSIIIASMVSSRIIKPLNEIDLKCPEKNEVYDELSPLLLKILKQREQITEKINLLDEERLRFNAITENMQEGFLVIDTNGNVMTYNASAINILSLDIENKKNRNVLSYNRSREFRYAMSQAAQGMASEQIINIKGRKFSILCNPVISDSVLSGSVIIILDMTEKLAREDLRKEFSANVSHELKTPLTSILGYAEIIENGIAKPSDVNRFAGKIHLEAERLLTLIGDIIKLSQLDEAQPLPEFSDVDIGEIAHQTAFQLENSAKKKSVTIETHITPVRVSGIKSLLEEVIYNIADNAIKYNRQNGHVNITVGFENSKPYILVSDTGVGIPTSHQASVFERFYRVDKSRSKESGGTGLGLSIVKHACEIHGAIITLESVEDVGTTIKILF